MCSLSENKDGGEARHPNAQFGYEIGTNNVPENAAVVLAEVNNVLVCCKQCSLCARLDSCSDVAITVRTSFQTRFLKEL